MVVHVEGREAGALLLNSSRQTIPTVFGPLIQAGPAAGFRYTPAGSQPRDPNTANAGGRVMGHLLAMSVVVTRTRLERPRIAAGHEPPQ